jgi:hypothetical protein
MLYEKLSPTFQDLAKRYPHLYANISTLTLLNRLRLLLHLCRITEIYERLLFGTDYPPIRIPRCRLRPRNLRHVMQDNPDKKPLRSASCSVSWAEDRLPLAWRSAPSADSKGNALASANHSGLCRDFRKAR